jgi:hypothetical protein
MSEFTKGPWVIEYDNSDSYGGGCWFNVGPATINFSYNISEEEERIVKANANLIAAAPDMLEALEALTAIVDRQPDFNDDGDGLALSRCYEAIAKAKGESQ